VKLFLKNDKTKLIPCSEIVIRGSKCSQMTDALSFRGLEKIGRYDANLLLRSTLNRTFKG
jgi:hypothetical protein